MAKILQLRCPICGRLAPATAWDKALGERYFGRVQWFEGYRNIRPGRKVYQPEDADWVEVEGFGAKIERRPRPSELVKKRLLDAFYWWLRENWLTDSDLTAVGLERLWLLPGIQRSVRAISSRRVVTTNTKKF